MLSKVWLTLALVAALAGTAQAQTASLMGSVVYRERVELPRTAVLIVTLEDVSSPDGSAVVVATERTPRPDHLPVMFSLRYDAARVVPAGRYVVSARIIDGAATLFSSAVPAPVLTQGRGSVANLVMAKMEPPPAPARAPEPKAPPAKTSRPVSTPVPKPTPKATPTPTPVAPSAMPEKASPAPSPTPAAPPVLKPPPVATPKPTPTPTPKPTPVAPPTKVVVPASLPPNPIADLPATFVGTLPCADCRAIRYELTLLADSSYSSRKTKAFDGKPDAVEDESGSWGYSSDRAVIVLKSRVENWSWFAFPAPGVLRAIDSRGNSIGARTGVDLQRRDAQPPTAAPISPNAVATPGPITLPLSGTEWQAMELENKYVRPVSKTQRRIVLTFDEDGGTFSGASGCNDLDGAIEAGWRTLTIKPRKSLRVCLADQGTERALSRTIRATRAYRVTGTILDLFDEQGARIARLEGRVK